MSGSVNKEEHMDEIQAILAEISLNFEADYCDIDREPFDPEEILCENVENLGIF